MQTKVLLHLLMLEALLCTYWVHIRFAKVKGVLLAVDGLEVGLIFMPLHCDSPG